MSIMKNISYNSKSDEIDGYQDHGLQGKSKVFASHALVFMLVWIRRRWKQPVAFYLSGDNVTADRLTVLIKEVLHECLKTGINVCATVCDMDGVNVRALENLGSTVENPFFIFEGEEIITLPDPPHLLKCFRNLFMSYDVKLPIPVQSTTTGNTIGTGIASWKHIKQFFELDNCNPHFVFAPKLSHHHIQPNGKEKMRVKLATQIFSHSVAMGIYSKASTNELPAGAVATATFLEHFNNLFDLLNADAPDRQEGKPYKTNLTAKSPHKDFFKKSVKFINDIEFIGCRRKPPSQGGWLKLLNGYERLWDNLLKKHQIKSIATRRINQDPLENCFGCIRANCGSNDNPTVAQFIAGLKTGIITNLRNIVKNNRNCEDDNGELVENFQYLFCKNKLNQKKNDDTMPESGPNVSEHDIISVSDDEIESSAETQACAYVCGFIFKKYIKDCDYCKKAMLAENPTEVHLFTQFKEYVDGKHSLHYANYNFIACVENSAELVKKYLKENSHSDHLKENCIKLIREEINFNFLNACPEHKLANKNMIEQSVAIILIRRFCLLENRKFSIESAKKKLAKKIKILKNS
ncbi:unnamed protein product [Colias eurytheme]|nr:unnamed protein product [Colias eurytheme]